MFIALRRGRGTSLIGARKLSRYRIFIVALAQCRGTKLIEAKKLSRCGILIAFRCALCPPKRSEGGCPGARTITNLS